MKGIGYVQAVQIEPLTLVKEGKIWKKLSRLGLQPSGTRNWND